MRIIAKGHCSESAMLWGKCAIIEIKPEAAVTVQQMRTIMAANPCLAQVVAWDTSVDYYENASLDDNDADVTDWPSDPALRMRLDDDGYLVLSPGLKLPFDEDEDLRVENSSVHVDGEHVWWRAHIRHGDAWVETPRIYLADLDCPIHWGDEHTRSLCLWCAVGASWRR